MNSDAEAYLAAKQQEILQKLTALQESIGKIEGNLTLDEKGHLHLPQLEKAVPEEGDESGTGEDGRVVPIYLSPALLVLQL